MKLKKHKKIFILAGEASSDFIGSCIMRGIKEYDNNIKFLELAGI